MSANTQFDLKMNAKEKACELLDRESRITMSDQDFQAFTIALDGKFTPNAALQNAMNTTPKPADKSPRNGPGLC